MTPFEDLGLLRTFVRIAESRSISAAARVLNMPQPTVSRQLRDLEKSSGLILVRRDTHAMGLTAAGEKLLEHARQLLSLAEICHEQMREERDIVRGHLRIVSVLDTGQWIISRLLAGFRKLHPEATAELHLTNRPSKFVAEGFDCGILVGPITDISLVARKAGEIERVLVGTPELLARFKTPRVPADLKDLPWMGVLQPHFFIRDRVPLRRGREHRIIQLSPVLVMDGVTALREAALEGAGITILPTWLIGSALASGKLTRLLPDWTVPPVDAHVVFPSGRLPERVRAIVNYAQEQLPLLLKELAAR